MFLLSKDKKYLDMHTNMSKAISDQLAARGFVHLWTAECELLRGGSPDLSSLLGGTNTASDQLRLLVLALAAGQRPTVPPQLAGDAALLLVQNRQGSKVSNRAEDDLLLKLSLCRPCKSATILWSDEDGARS